ncbi:hypothetical protein DFP72DRAFT_852891 [Ephemerocybe angulata]|uniref:Uncharacterized protein n=1 Tax=Ephemerocybe angulata TaxID=980116 RepID=A0A8H6HMQ6_9AGAR|nr:hypothetical protein DFP72DRAFT_852891 [Tulosesus angulatus]
MCQEECGESDGGLFNVFRKAPGAGKIRPDMLSDPVTSTRTRLIVIYLPYTLYAPHYIHYELPLPSLIRCLSPVKVVRSVARVKLGRSLSLEFRKAASVACLIPPIFSSTSSDGFVSCNYLEETDGRVVDEYPGHPPSPVCPSRLPRYHFAQRRLPLSDVNSEQFVNGRLPLARIILIANPMMTVFSDFERRRCIVYGGRSDACVIFYYWGEWKFTCMEGLNLNIENLRKEEQGVYELIRKRPDAWGPWGPWQARLIVEGTSPRLPTPSHARRSHHGVHTSTDMSSRKWPTTVLVTWTPIFLD